MDLDQIQSFLTDAIQHEVVKWSVAFSIAAFVHSRQIRKEIRFQVGNITDSIKDVARTLKEDLDKQGKRLDNVETGIKHINSRVVKLEGRRK